MQVDPIKPVLKAPKTKRLKLEVVEPLSTVAFRFSWRRYTTEPPMDYLQGLNGVKDFTGSAASLVFSKAASTSGSGAGAYTRSRFRST